GAHSSALADLLHGDTREAVATVDVGNINIAGGAVTITNLHWEATQYTGAQTKSDGKFTMGSLLIGGQSIPTNDPSAAFAGVNQALAPFGVELRPPKIHNDNGLLVVDPLAIAVVPAPARPVRRARRRRAQAAPGSPDGSPHPPAAVAAGCWPPSPPSASDSSSQQSKVTAA